MEPRQVPEKESREVSFQAVVLLRAWPLLGLRAWSRELAVSSQLDRYSSCLLELRI